MSEINKVGDIIEFNATDGSPQVFKNSKLFWKKIKVTCYGGRGGKGGEGKGGSTKSPAREGSPSKGYQSIINIDDINTHITITVGTDAEETLQGTKTTSYTTWGGIDGGTGGISSISISGIIKSQSLGGNGGVGRVITQNNFYSGTPQPGAPQDDTAENIGTLIEDDTNNPGTGKVIVEILEMYPPDTEVDNVLGNNINDIEFAKLEDISSSTKLSQEEIQEYGFEKFFKSTKVDNELTYEHSPFHRFISEEYNTLIGMGYQVGSCFTKDNGLVSWGADAQIINNQSQRLAPVVQLSVYGYHGLVLLADGTAVAWGRDSENQVSHTPKKKFKYVSAGDYFNGGILETGEVVFWGALGGTQMNGNGHSNTNGILNGIQLACGVAGGLLLKDDGYIVGFGEHSEKIPKDKKYVYVCASYKNRGAIRAEDGGIEIWGTSGAIISGIPKTGGFHKMALHDNGGIALRPDGTYEAWGTNTSTYDKSIPDVIDVCASRTTVSVIQKDGTITVWGADVDKIIANTRAIAPKIKNMVFEKNKDILPVVIGKDAIKKYNGYFTNEKDINNHDIEMNRYIDMIALSGSDFYNVEAEQCIVSKDNMVINTKYDLLKRFSNDVQIQGLIGEKKINKLDTLDTQKILPYTNPVFEFDPKPLPIYRSMDKYVTEEDDGRYSMEIPTYGRDIMNITSDFGRGQSLGDYTHIPIGGIIDISEPTEFKLYSDLVYSDKQKIIGVKIENSSIFDCSHKVIDEETGNIISSGTLFIKAGGTVYIPIPDYNKKMRLILIPNTKGTITSVNMVTTNIINIENLNYIYGNSISNGYYHCTALKKDGSLVSWGSNNYGQITNTPKGNDFVMVSCGYNHCTALKKDGSLVSWGENYIQVVSNTPKGNDFVMVSCGAYHCTALKKDGSLISWGDNNYRQITNTPKGNDFVMVSCGQYHATALRKDGSLISWGYDGNRQVTNTPKGNDFVMVSCGYTHCTALKKDGSLVSWGNNSYNQVSDTPKGNDFVMVSCGMYHCTALKKDGSLVSWGNNNYGQITNTPKGNDFVMVSCGYYHCTALKKDGSLVSWGYNNTNQVTNTPKESVFTYDENLPTLDNIGMYSGDGSKIESLPLSEDNIFKGYNIQCEIKLLKAMEPNIGYLQVDDTNIGVVAGTNSAYSENKLGYKYNLFYTSPGGAPILGNYLTDNPSLLSKNNIKLYTGNLEDLQKIKIKYNANLAPKMLDFSTTLDTVHDEHALITGDIFDNERDPIKIETTVVNNSVNIYTDIIESPYKHRYQKAFHFNNNLNAGTNTVTVKSTDDRNLSTTWTTNIVVQNTLPVSTYVYNDRYVTALISDADNDTVSVTLKNITTGETIDETILLDTPFVYRYKFKPGDTRFNVANAMEMHVTDSFNQTTIYKFGVNGVYMSIMFQDENGAYYSDDKGNILKPLDFKKIQSGNDVFAKIRVLNSTSYDLSKVRLTPEYGNLPEGVRISLVEDVLGHEEEWVDELVLPNILKNNDYADIKVRISSEIGTVKLKAEFGLSATGNIVVGRDGIPEEERKTFMKMGYTISE